MFSKRRNSSAKPTANRSTASAAAIAATQAAINHSKSASLSSAAAAAALRSHTTTPEPVGNLVTKRMVRRGSVSSQTSNNVYTSAAPTRGGLQRTNSSGSMTERTFRSSSQSPNRASAASPTPDRPPMPPLPRTLRSGPSKRPGSTEPPARVFSPTPSRGMRSASVDQTNLKASHNRVSQIQDASSTGNRASVNFSRPRVASPEPAASPSSSKAHAQGGWISGPVGSKPASLDTNKQSEGMEQVMVYDANSRTFVKSFRPKPKAAESSSPVVAAMPVPKPGEYDPATRKITPIAQLQRTSSSEQVPPAAKAPPPVHPRPNTLHKQPSTVREDPDEDRAANELPIKKRAAVTATEPMPAKTYIAPTPSHQRSSSLEVPGSRGGSISPSRSTRFSAAPMQNVHHEPVRGVSPVKSALKHSPSSSIRTASPITTFSPSPALQTGASDVSDTTSQTSADGSMLGVKKRRSVRVSFDDEGTVPPIPAMSKATPAKPRVPDIASDEDGDDYSSPRPVLPSFGSVRKSSDNRPNGHASEPLAPEVTSKDAAEPAVDLSEDEEPRKQAAEPVVSAPIVTNVVRKQEESVPAINLYPPTPGIDETARELLTDDDTAQQSDSQELRALAQGIVRYGDESDSSSVPPIQKTPAPPIMRHNSDNDVYSDAPESQDASQAGFASLDAIVESPVGSPKRTTAPELNSIVTPESPSKAAPVDWSATSARWSQHKAQAQQSQLSSGDEKPKRSFFGRRKKKDVSRTDPPRATSPESVETQPEPAAENKSAAIVPPVIIPEKTVADTQPASPITTPTKSTPKPSAQPLKSALRNSSAVAAPADGAHHMPRTMRGATRPASMSTPSTELRSKPQRASHSGAYASQLPASKTIAANQDDSDSDTSFRKKRRSQSTDKYTMRRSMRTGSIDSTQRSALAPPNARSMSPMSDSGREGKAASLRQSLRSSGPPARTMRNTPAAKTTPRPNASTMSRFKSRFADSDDSGDETRPGAYRSRFIDSDEDDTIAEELTPVRGIPRRKGQEDGDSTDLEDESDGGRGKRTKATAIVVNPADVEKAMDLARKSLGMQNDGTTNSQVPKRDRENDKVLIPKDVLSDAESEATTVRRKRGFMRGLLGRSRGSSYSMQRADSPPPPLPSSPQTGKLIRRTSQPPLPRQNSGLAQPAPKDENWPLPPPVPKDTTATLADRPQTSDDNLLSTRVSERPENRRTLSARVGFTDEAVAQSEKGVAADKNAVYSQRTGRKKKFGMLRRAFGLTD